mgnify:CR=1 FL=1
MVIPIIKLIDGHATQSKTSALTPLRVEKYLEENLPQYMIPKKIILINNFPLTPNEKIDYKKIIHKYE